MAVGAATQANWRDVDLRSHATALYVDEHCVTHGSGADVLGDPRDALTWLVNTLCAQNIDISVGQLVTTGVTGQPSPVHAGHKVCADLGAFGQVEVELVD